MQKAEHSFLVVGVVAEGENYQIARFGKNCPPIIDASKVVRFFKMYLYQNPSFMKREGLVLQGKLSYDAHDISADVYQKLVEFMPNFAYQKEAGCYGRRQLEDQLLYQMFVDKTGKERETEGLTVQEQQLIERSAFLTNNNSCRTTAAEIVELVTKEQIKIDKDHRHPLPCKSRFVDGKPDQPLFIMPLPVTQFPDADTKVLTALYQRMEELRRVESGHNKFQLLKKLYTEISQIPSHQSQQIRQVILACKEQHQQILNQHRHHWDLVHHTTKTMRLLNSILES